MTPAFTVGFSAFACCDSTLTTAPLILAAASAAVLLPGLASFHEDIARIKGTSKHSRMVASSQSEFAGADYFSRFRMITDIFFVGRNSVGRSSFSPAPQ